MVQFPFRCATMFRPDGQPMVFYIPPGDTRKALTDLIEVWFTLIRDQLIKLPTNSLTILIAHHDCLPTTHPQLYTTNTNPLNPQQDNGGVVHKKWNEGDIVLISESDGGAQKTLPKGIEAYKVDFIDQSLRAKELQVRRLPFPSVPFSVFLCLFFQLFLCRRPRFPSSYFGNGMVRPLRLTMLTTLLINRI